jgi:hypothetical protein
MNTEGGDWNDEASPRLRASAFMDPGLRRDDGSNHLIEPLFLTGRQALDFSREGAKTQGAT